MGLLPIFAGVKLIVGERKLEQEGYIMDNSGPELLKLLKAYTSGRTNNSIIDNRKGNLNSSEGLTESLDWEIRPSNISEDPFLQNYGYNESLR